MAKNVKALEVNFDGLVGPTHNYAGLSYGNLASTRHFGSTASPRRAAIQGLEKMRLVNSLGICQGVLPPLRRPRLDLLRDLGFSGSDPRIIDAAWRTDPVLVGACFSASSMWTANAATISPSADCADGRLHITPANLSSGLHRSVEAPETLAILRQIFCDNDRFCVHPPLPSGVALADEGAANHTRLCRAFDQPGLEVFVFGKSMFDKSLPVPARFPARQTLEASQAIARRHQLRNQATLFVQQEPIAIDAGVFHNDVISVGTANMLLVHEKSFLGGPQAIDHIKSAGHKILDESLYVWCATESQLSLHDAVNSYLFNSQLLARPDGKMTLLCPADVQENEAARKCAEDIVARENPVDEVRFIDLRQSMNNGGGPACLRLRIVMTEDELAHIHQSVLFDDKLYEALRDWVNRNYREELAADDLRDPALLDEVDVAFQELTEILKLPSHLFRLAD